MAFDIELGLFEECRIIRYQFYLRRIYDFYFFFEISHKAGLIILYKIRDAHHLKSLVAQAVCLDSFYYPLFAPDDNPHARCVFHFCHVLSPSLLTLIGYMFTASNIRLL